jgi:hypothetical protein
MDGKRDWRLLYRDEGGALARFEVEGSACDEEEETLMVKSPDR